MSKIVFRNVSDIESALNWIENEGTITPEDMVSFSGKSGSAYLYIYEVLFDNILISGLSRPEWKAVIRRGVLYYLKHRKQDHREPNITKLFETHLDEALSMVKSVQKRYSVIAYLNFMPPKEFENGVDVKGYRIEFISRDDLLSFEIEKLRSEAAKHKYLTDYDFPNVFDRRVDSLDKNTEEYLFNPAKLVIFSYDDESAFEQALEVIDVFISTLNFTSSSTLIIRHANIYEPIGEFAPPHIIGVFDDKGLLLRKGFLLQPYPYRIIKLQKLSDIHIKNTKFFLERLNSNHELALLLEKCFIIYQQGMTSLNPEKTYLSFWQILEIIILDSNDQKRSVSPRVISLLGIQNDKIKSSIISTIERQRHNLVHSSNSSVSEVRYLIYELKRYAESMIIRLCHLWDEISSAIELDEYISNLSVANKELENRLLKAKDEKARLEARIKVIKVIKSKR